MRLPVGVTSQKETPRQPVDETWTSRIWRSSSQGVRDVGGSQISTAGYRTASGSTMDSTDTIENENESPFLHNEDFPALNGCNKLVTQNPKIHPDPDHSGTATIAEIASFTVDPVTDFDSTNDLMVCDTETGTVSVEDTVDSSASMESTDENAVDDLPTLDYSAVLDFFRQARRCRHERWKSQPWGILGSFAYLDDLRADLEWSKEATLRFQMNRMYLEWKDYLDLRERLAPLPYFTLAVIAVSTGLMIRSLQLNDWRFEPIRSNPMFGPSAETLIKMGALYAPYIHDEQEWFRIFVPIVLHAGIIHYVINMLAIGFIGRSVERVHGWLKTALIFLISSVGGNIASALLMPSAISVGASGGIFGLLGLCLADVCANWHVIQASRDDPSYSFPIRSVVVWLIFEVALNVSIGLTPYIDNFAHMGGFLYGFTFGLAIVQRLGGKAFYPKMEIQVHRIRKTAYRFCGLTVTLLLLALTSWKLWINDGDDPSPCSWCRYLSCAPFPAGTDNPWWRCDGCDYVKAAFYEHSLGSGFNDELDLFCPYSPTVTIDLGTVKDRFHRSLVDQLPELCRNFC